MVLVPVRRQKERVSSPNAASQTPALRVDYAPNSPETEMPSLTRLLSIWSMHDTKEGGHLLCTLHLSRTMTSLEERRGCVFFRHLLPSSAAGVGCRVSARLPFIHLGQHQGQHHNDQHQQQARGGSASSRFPLRASAAAERQNPGDNLIISPRFGGRKMQAAMAPSNLGVRVFTAQLGAGSL